MKVTLTALIRSGSTRAMRPSSMPRITGTGGSAGTGCKADHTAERGANQLCSVGSKSSAELQMPIVAGLLPLCIAWISADFDRNALPLRRRTPA